MDINGQARLDRDRRPRHRAARRQGGWRTFYSLPAPGPMRCAILTAPGARHQQRPRASTRCRQLHAALFLFPEPNTVGTRHRCVDFTAVIGLNRGSDGVRPAEQSQLLRPSAAGGGGLKAPCRSGCSSLIPIVSKPTRPGPDQCCRLPSAWDSQIAARLELQANACSFPAPCWAAALRGTDTASSHPRRGSALWAKVRALLDS